MRAYGTLARSKDGDQWFIRAEPHVMMRLKRVFGRVDKAAMGGAALGDRPETAYELRWFMQRYPLEAEPAALAHLEARARSYEESLARIQLMLAADYTPSPVESALPPRAYQALAADLARATGGLLVADDVGLGKTAEALFTVAPPAYRPALVVTLPHLQTQWVEQTAKFFPGLRTHIIKRRQPYDLANVFGTGPDIIVTTYSKLDAWAETLAPVVKAVVYDETQELRRGYGENKDTPSRKYTAAMHLAEAVALRVGITATPFYNYAGDEMYHVLEALKPGALGSRSEYALEWCGERGLAKNAKIKRPREFGHYLREQGLMIRRTRKDVGRELPPLSRIVQPIEADLEALEKVKPDATELARFIVSQNPTVEKGKKLRASQELSMKLRQATGIAKAPFVAAFVRMLLGNDEPVILYGWHHAVYDLWKSMLADLEPAMYTGQETPREKDEAKARFVKGKTKLLIMSLRAGAGVDGLQDICRTPVFGELDWSPGVHEQCIGRVWRDGQAEATQAFFLVAECGSDPVVADVLGLKRQQIEGVRDPDAELFDDLHVDENHVKRLAEDYLRRQR